MSEVNEPVTDNVDVEVDETEHEPALCAKAAHCPFKQFDKNGVAIHVAALAVSAVIAAASVYAQYVLTKWAVKSALKETRLR